MEATCELKIVQLALNMAHEKETVRSLNVVLMSEYDGAIREPITIRWYKARRGGRVIHCSVWIRGWENIHISGYGNAKGYGYDKFSSAFSSALGATGIKLWKSTEVYGNDLPPAADIDGAGMDAVRDACRAICRMVGYSNQPYFVEN